MLWGISLFVCPLSAVAKLEIKHSENWGITGSVGDNSDIAYGGLAIYVTNKMVQAMLVKNTILAFIFGFFLFHNKTAICIELLLKQTTVANHIQLCA